MKFTFEADMEKGKCSACPFLVFLNTNDSWCGWDWSCALTKEATALEVEPEECPLMEEHEATGIVWHPYPSEKPQHHGRFCVSYINVKRSNRKEFHCVKYSHEGFASYDKFIYAWAELPKPYEEET